jgi:hypothetical protein
MAASLPSQSFRPAAPLELPVGVRKVIADIPAVIFFKAVREAFFGAQPAPARRGVGR